MSTKPRPDQARKPRRRKRGVAVQVTVASLQADSRSYIETKMAYNLAFSELCALPPAGDALAAQTAVVLGKLLEYQEAFKVLASHDALLALQGLKDSEEKSTAERFYQDSLLKLERLTVLEQEYRVDRVVLNVYVLACLRRSRENG